MRRLLGMLFLGAFVTLSSLAQTAVVTVGGDVGKALKLDAKALQAMPRTTLVADDHGKKVSYSGVLLHEVLKTAGVPAGEQLRGKEVASYLLMTAADGYQVVFALPEVDPMFQDSQILLADTADGKALGEKAGPFRIVAPKDKRGARSIRMLQRIELVRLRK